MALLVVLSSAAWAFSHSRSSDLAVALRFHSEIVKTLETRSTDLAINALRLRGGKNEQSLWNKYNTFSERHPFESNIVTCGAIAGVLPDAQTASPYLCPVSSEQLSHHFPRPAVGGDAFMQILDQSSSYDYLRTLRFVIYRVAVVVPLYSAWMALLNKASLPGSPLQQAAAKAILDNLFFSPPAQLLFYTAMALLEGKSGQVALQRCASMMPKSLPASWVFWGPTQLVCFALIPPHLRVAFVQAAGFIWNIFMSFFGQSARSTKSP